MTLFHQIIGEFFVNEATYSLKDKSGNEILLKLDYRRGKFEVIPVRVVGRTSQRLVREAKNTARDLLRRKSNINLVER